MTYILLIFFSFLPVKEKKKRKDKQNKAKKEDSGSEGDYRLVNKQPLMCIDPFLTSRLVHPYHLDESISSFRGPWWIFPFSLYFCTEISVSKQC